MPAAAKPRRKRERIALVLAGGGARGAYEAGVLKGLAPALAAHGQSPDIIVGTSIGALNGSFFAARADERLELAAAAAVEMWRELRWGDALRPLSSPVELARLLVGAGMLAHLPGADLSALLDSAPLRGTLEQRVSFERITRNVQDGALTAAAVVATAYATTRSVVFHQGGPAIKVDATRAIEYFSTELKPEHVLASAAIPGAFPAVEIEEPQAAAGWYSDGGVRLNAPLKPALMLGADRVIVVGLNSSTTPAAETTRAAVARRPDAIDGVAQLLQVVLADQLAEDVATLATVNETLASTGSSGATKRAGRKQRRRVPYIFIAPCDRLEIGRLARKVYKQRYTGVGGIARDSNVAGLGWLVNAGHSAVHGELLSYLFLAHEFIDELIARGRRDAERWLEAEHDAGLWQVGRLPG
ncbi:MAG: patatin-like phospholipase family protein [Solirubrobacteraceae bacterium]|jgi:NTE family protein